MGSGHKRHHHGHNGGKSGRSHRHSNGSHNSYQSTSSSKRRRLSYDDSRDRDVMQTADTADPSAAEDGWTKVSYGKGHEKRSKSQSESASALSCADGRATSNSSLPRISYHHNLKFDIQIRDLQLLPLYVLADGIAPNWCGVAGKYDIRKVVVLMVPGLDSWALNRGKVLLKEKSLNTIQEEQKIRPSPGWLFANIIDVQAPGDPKLAKVHSPLQAMLLCPEHDKSKREARGRGFEAVATPITEFIHTPDELRNAEFPIHPAAFTSNPDAELESSRRTLTGRMTRDGWVDTAVAISHPGHQANPTDWLTQDLTLYAIDCEMVQTSDEALSLARVSVVDHHGEVVLDKYVKPSLSITNYFTQYSGITPEHLADVTTSLADIQQQLLSLFTADTVLLGHSLESDLNALRLTHPFIIDTALLYPHARGLPLRNALKYLTSRYLRREIQTAGAKGHDSVEDARAVMDLVKLKCEKGPKWGTLEANGEPIFKRLTNAGRTSAIVEYGTPGKGLGKDATYHIGCQDDSKIVAGVVCAVRGGISGEPDSETAVEIPQGGTEFVWARLRALEILRGWASSSPGKSMIKGETENLDTEQHTIKDQACDDAILSTIANIGNIHASLPQQTLLLVFSGTSDVRPVHKLQAQQQQYRREFKTKKWDEVSVQWTDREEQALRKACNEARKGWAVAVVT